MVIKNSDSLLKSINNNLYFIFGINAPSNSIY